MRVCGEVVGRFLEQHWRAYKECCCRLSYPEIERAREPGEPVWNDDSVSKASV